MPVGMAIARPTNAVNTVLVMNSRATRWMLRRIWRPSATIPGKTPKSSRTSTRSATERDIRPGALGDRQPRLLERQHVVDPVADHRDVATPACERVHHRRLPWARSARQPARRGSALAAWRDRPAAPRRPGAPSIPVHPRRALWLPRSRGHTQQHLQIDVLSGEERDRLACVGPQALSEQDEAERLNVDWKMSARTRWCPESIGFGRAPTPVPRRRLPRALVQPATVGVSEPLGRPEHQFLVAEVERAPTMPGRNGTCATTRRPGISARPAWQSPRASGCATARWRHKCELTRKRGLVLALRRHQPDQPQRRLGERAGLVGTEDIDRGQRLDRVELLASTPRWAILNADTAAVTLISKIRPSGTRLTIPAVTTCTRALADSARARANQPSPTASGTRARSTTAAADRLRAPAASAGDETPAPSRSAAPPGSPADRCRLEQRCPLHHERARPHRLSRTPDDRLRLARQICLVQREPVSRHYRPVRDDLVARRQPHLCLITTSSTGTGGQLHPAPPSPRERPAPPAGRALAWSESPGTSRSRCSTPGSRETRHPATSRRRSSTRQTTAGSRSES